MLSNNSPGDVHRTAGRGRWGKLALVGERLGEASGVGDNIIRRCLARMRAWNTLARAAVSAEFPNFEVAQAFQIFDLSSNVLPATTDVGWR